MSTTTDLEALKSALRQETKDFVSNLEEQLKTGSEALAKEAQNILLTSFEQMKELKTRGDEQAFEFFDKNIQLLGEEHLEDAEKVLRQQLEISRKALQDFKKRFLG